ncbi:MAG TPA: hypothetical protein VIT91_04810 [Chthoniobacterales bacterium]
MKGRSYHLVAGLVASVVVVLVAFSIGRRSQSEEDRGGHSSTVVKGETSQEKPASDEPAVASSSRMMVDADPAGGAGKASQGKTDGVLPGSRSAVAAPLKGAVATRAEATLTIGDKKVNLEPNQIGAFPQVLVQPRQQITVEMVYPDGSPGDLVVAAVMDGGQLENGQHVLSLRLDDSRQVKFNYAVSEEEGVFRITLRKGGDLKTVELWAGAEPPLIGAR